MGESPERARLEASARAAGMSLFGAAEAGPLRATFDPAFVQTAARLPYALSLGLALSGPILETLSDGPNRLYYFHYRAANNLLDQAALRLAGEIQARGKQALPVPASQFVNPDVLAGHLSHRAVGRAAGHGWIGRSCLLVNPYYGARVRYVTILTDLELPANAPVAADCGDCRACVEACPAGAIGERPEEFDLARCIAKLEEFARRQRWGRQLICGLCVKACRGR